MGKRLRRFQTTQSLVLGAATLTLLWLPGSMHAQSTATQGTQSMATQDRTSTSTSTQDRQGTQADDITRRDLARFDQFLDSHREIAEQLRKTPSLIDDPQFLQSHPELNTYLQDHPSVKQEISQQPNTFMRLEDAYDRDHSLRDRDAGMQDRDASVRDRDDRNAGGQDRDRGDVASFDRFLDGHREIAEQVRKDPSLLDNRNFVQNHPALQSYLQDNPGVRDQLRQDPNGFMRQENLADRDPSQRDRDDRMAAFGGFLGDHPDIRKDLSKNPSVVKDHDYMENHAELNNYLSAHPDVRDQLMANPQSFVQGAQQHSSGSVSGAANGSGVVDGRGTGSTGTTTGTPAGTTAGSPSGTPTTNPPTPTHSPAKPNQ